MARRRLVAPARGSVHPCCFDSPLFDGFRRHSAWFTAPEWPPFDVMNAALVGAHHPHSGAPLRFVEQTPALLADGLHYEQRIYERGEIATRAGSWHDLFNALIWIEQRALKAALNARQVADVSKVGQAQRTRAQCALTHFDEGGALVVLRDRSLLRRWDAHDWHGLFCGERAAWSDGRAQAFIVGHALLEHALLPEPVHTAKCIVVLGDHEAVSGKLDASTCASVAKAISNGEVLLDPQELRPLPLSGIPGWHPATSLDSFYGEAPCFRPLRDGRLYPAPLGTP